MTDSVGRLIQKLGTKWNAGADDAELLSRFVAAGDEAAFAAIVDRHGPMVLGVCRRVLGNADDAADALQGAFLVLARRAAVIRRRQSLASWLCGVGYRVALAMRSRRARRRRPEQEHAVAEAAPAPDPAWRELLAALDGELQRLPEKHRQPLVLCYLEGLSQAEAAEQLGWPRGTLKRRLEGGRDLLRRRLARRGLTLGAASLATLSAARALAVPLPPPAGVTLASAAGLLRARRPLPPELVDPSVRSIVEGVVKRMTFRKIKLACFVALFLTLSAGGAWLYAQTHAGAPEAAPAPEVVATPPAQPVAPKQGGDPKKQPADQDRLQGVWRVVEFEAGGRKLPGLNDDRFEFKGKTVTWGKLKGEFKLNEKAKPRAMDIIWDEQPSPTGGEVKITWEAIYKFEGEKLRICRGGNKTPPGPPPSGPRPTEFSAKEGEDGILMVLERVKK